MAVRPSIGGLGRKLFPASLFLELRRPGRSQGPHTLPGNLKTGEIKFQGATLGRIWRTGGVNLDGPSPASSAGSQSGSVPPIGLTYHQRAFSVGARGSNKESDTYRRISLHSCVTPNLTVQISHTAQFYPVIALFSICSITCFRDFCLQYQAIISLQTFHGTSGQR